MYENRHLRTVQVMSNLKEIDGVEPTHQTAQVRKKAHLVHQQERKGEILPLKETKAIRARKIPKSWVETTNRSTIKT